MIRVGYAPAPSICSIIGHLNLLRRAKERCDFLIAGAGRSGISISMANRAFTAAPPLELPKWPDRRRPRTQLCSGDWI